MNDYNKMLAKNTFLNSEHREFLFKAINLVVNYYKDNLKTLVIFGSYARGTFRLNSDVDLFIILKKKESRSKALEEFILQIEKPLQKDEFNLYDRYGIDISLSSFILSQKEAAYFYPIYLDMIDYSIIIADEGDFFKNILNNLISIRNKYGFKKENMGNRYIWDMTAKNMVGEKIYKIYG